MKNLDYQNLNKAIAILLITIFIVSSMPNTYGQEVRGGKIKELEDAEVFDIGEDITINIDTYQPRVIRTSLLEDQNIVVYALLKGIPTNPTITIPRIRNIVPRVTKITTKPEGKKVNIGAISYINPISESALTRTKIPFTNVEVPFITPGFREKPNFYNLGYLVIPISRIPKEEDIPDEIQIDMSARIYLDVSEGLAFSKFSDVLTEQTFDEWQRESSQHSFFGGFIRASEVKDDSASFILYDEGLKEISPRAITVKRGESSGIINPPSTGFIHGLFNRFRIRVNDIRIVSDKARVIIYKDDEQLQRTLTKGQTLYEGSEWFLDDIKRKIENGREVFEITFRNVATRSAIKRFTACLRNCKIEQKAIIAETLEKQECNLIQKKDECNKRTDCAWIAEFFGEGCSSIVTEVASIDKEAESELNILIDEYNERKADAEEDYDDLVNEFKEIAVNQNFHEDIRNKARSQLRDIKLQYNKLLIAAIDSKDKIKEEKFSNKILEIDDFLKKEEDIRTTTLIKEPKEIEEFYRNAIKEYEQVVINYPDIRGEDGELYAAKAQLRIAEIYQVILGDESRAAMEYKKLLEFYPGSRIYNEQVIKNRIKVLEGLVGNTQLETFELDDRGKKIRVTIFGIDKLEQRDIPKADIEISELDVQGRKISVSKHTLDLNQDIISDTESKWVLQDIGAESITIIRINKATGRVLETSVISRGKPKSVKVNGKSISILFMSAKDLRKEAHITIEPEVEQAITQASFSLHIPIEKRPFDLPLFSESLDKEIAKTEELVKKLTNVINNVEKIHNFWIKACYVTFGALWTKNLLQGGAKILAKQRIKDKWQDKYRSEVSSGKFRGTFDQYLIQNNKEYMTDLNSAQTVISNINKNQYKDIPSELKDVDKEAVKDWLFYRELSKQDPAYLDKFVDMDFNTRILKRIDTDIESKIKDIEEIAKTNPGRNGERIRKKFEEAGIIRSDAYDNYETYYQLNKGNLLMQYRDIKKREELRNFFDKGYESWKEDLGIQIPKENDDKFSEKFRARGANIFTDIKFESISQSSLIFKDKEKGFFISLPNRREDLPLYINEDNCKKNGPLLGLDKKYEKAKEYYYKENNECKKIKISDETLTILPYIKKATLFKEGLNKGKVEFISIDPTNYAQVIYTTGGAVKSIDIFQRAETNALLGSPGFREGEINDVLKALKESKLEKDMKLKSAMERVRGDVLACNRVLKGSYLKGDKICNGYAVEEAAPTEIRGNCADYMDPLDCRLLFNACDPVICPASRCNAGGRWTVNNVVETGIVGSAVLCLPNFPEVVMPVCITGILAGLQNIRSILQGYGECLKVKKVSGTSVGICDRIRNVFVCEILWREAIAIFNVKGGLIGYLSDKVFDRNSGGGEYATFRQSIDNSVGSLKFFTQNYAKNVFAAYQGGSLDEIGTEICKSAIFGKVPGVGDFFDQISRPQSPPQFIAFFDQVPYSDIPRVPQSQYSIFYHIYAGENENVRYSIFLRGTDAFNRNIIRFIVRNSLLNKGEFANANVDRIYESGYNEICVEISTLSLGTRLECGFGKVTTDFGINYLTDVFAARDALKNIKTAEECVPETGRLTDLAYRDSRLQGSLNIGRAAVGSFSTGLTQTGIVRKCSLHNPGIGVNEQSWVPVGTCGFDERKRDLGTCWLYRPLVGQLIKDVERENQTLINLEQRSQELIEKGIPGIEVIPDDLVTREDGLLSQAFLARAMSRFKDAINIFRDIIRRSVNNALKAQAQFEIALTYEEWARSKRSETEPKIELKVCKEPKQCFEINKCKEGTIEVNTICAEDGFYCCELKEPGIEEKVEEPRLEQAIMSDFNTLYITLKEGETRLFTLFDRTKEYGIKLDRIDYPNDIELEFVSNGAVLHRTILYRVGTKLELDLDNNNKPDLATTLEDFSSNEAKLTLERLEQETLFARVGREIREFASRFFGEETAEAAEPIQRPEVIEDEQEISTKKIVINPQCELNKYSTYSVAEGILTTLEGEVSIIRNRNEDCLSEQEVIRAVNNDAGREDIFLTIKLTNQENKLEYASSNGLLFANYLKSNLGQDFTILFSNQNLLIDTEPIAIKISVNANKVTRDEINGFISAVSSAISDYLFWDNLPLTSKLTYSNPPLADRSYLNIISSNTNDRNLKVLTSAVIDQESKFNPFAVSSAGAAGLMQLMPDTARAQGLEVPNYGRGDCKNVDGIIKGCFENDDRFNPEENIEAGTSYLENQLQEFNDERLALAAYNYGPSNIKRLCRSNFDSCRNLPIETRNYVAQVIRNKEVFETVIG